MSEGLNEQAVENVETAGVEAGGTEAPAEVELGPEGYPLGVKPEDMAPEHQAAYYRNLSVKAAKALKAAQAERESWEADKRRASMSEDDAAKDKLREELRAEIRQEESQRTAATFIAAVAKMRGMSDEEVDFFTESLNVKSILDEAGDVDPDKLDRLLSKWKGDGGEKKHPVYTSHQGNRGPSPRPSEQDIGRAAFERRHGKN